MGVAPLLEILNNIDECDAYIGFKCSTFKTEEFQKLCRNLCIATEDGSLGFKGFVTDLIDDIKKYDIVYAVLQAPCLKLRHFVGWRVFLLYVCQERINWDGHVLYVHVIHK